MDLMERYYTKEARNAPKGISIIKTVITKDRTLDMISALLMKSEGNMD